MSSFGNARVLSVHDRFTWRICRYDIVLRRSSKYWKIYHCGLGDDEKNLIRFPTTPPPTKIRFRFDTTVNTVVFANLPRFKIIIYLSVSRRRHVRGSPWRVKSTFSRVIRRGLGPQSDVGVCVFVEDGFSGTPVRSIFRGPTRPENSYLKSSAIRYL